MASEGRRKRPTLADCGVPVSVSAKPGMLPQMLLYKVWTADQLRRHLPGPVSDADAQAPLPDMNQNLNLH